MPTSAFDTLAGILEQQTWALLTTVDRTGSIHTRPVRSLRGPFRGHLWLQTASDHDAAEEIGEGSEVSVAFGEGGKRPCVTVCGWAVALDADDPMPETAGTTTDRLQAGLVCVTARAAELWAASPDGTSCVFAFPSLHPGSGRDESVPG